MERETIKKAQMEGILEIRKSGYMNSNCRFKHHQQNTKNGGKNLRHEDIIEEID